MADVLSGSRRLAWRLAGRTRARGSAAIVILAAMVDPIALDALLLRTRLPELVLRPGLSVVARVAARGQGEHGVLVLAGVPLTAKLPEAVEAGETLRLHVTEVTEERVVMRMESPVAAPASPMAPPPPRVAVEEPPRQERRAEGDERAGVSLTFTGARVGRLDLRVEVGPDGVGATVTAAAGDPYDRAEAAAGRLRETLEASTGRPAAVHVHPRRDPLDLYA